MRTTPELDDDVLSAARVLDRQRQSTIGDVICGLARPGLPQLPVKATGGVVDLELVNQLREEEV